MAGHEAPEQALAGGWYVGALPSHWYTGAEVGCRGTGACRHVDLGPGVQEQEQEQAVSKPVGSSRVGKRIAGRDGDRSQWEEGQVKCMGKWMGRVASELHGKGPTTGGIQRPCKCGTSILRVRVLGYAEWEEL